jgi:predicted nuclease of predicted toxin-antitoxin system
MRFLIDECLSPDVGEVLREHGHDVIHVRDLGMQRATDQEVLDRASDERRILVSADTDFGAILAQLGAAQPSVVVFRRGTGRRPSHQAALLLANLAEIAEALDEGSVVVLEEARVRIRRLPIVG